MGAENYEMDIVERGNQKKVTTTQQPTRGNTGVVIPTTPPNNKVNYVLSLFLCIFGFCPTGISAVYYSILVSLYVKQGNLFAAWDASRSAKIMCAITVMAAIVFDVMIVVVIMFKPEASEEEDHGEGGGGGGHH